MSEQVSIPVTNSFSMLRAMVGIGALCALLIVLTYEGTLPRVERLKAEALQRAIFQVVPEISDTKAFCWENGALTAATEASGSVIYAGYNELGEFKGVAIEASGQGYADIIRILYGYDPEKQAVVGFYVLESKETPGLGDKIEKEERFLSNFISLDVSLSDNLQSLVNEVIPVKSGEKQNPWEVDGITGATISSRAIGNIINESMKVWAPRIYQNKDYFSNQL